MRGLGAALLGFSIASFGTVAALRYADPPATSFMLQRELEAWRTQRHDFAVRQRWVPLSELPEAVALAVICAEDQRFFGHPGFDLDALKHAVGAHLQGAPLRGASTLTQQVAKNLFLWEGRSFLRKGLEAYFTLLIELAWPKRRILEVYLNVAELGDGIFGVEAGARHHFGHGARQLTASEAALLAALLPDPRGRGQGPPSPRVRRKQGWVLEQMRNARAHFPRGITAAREPEIDLVRAR